MVVSCCVIAEVATAVVVYKLTSGGTLRYKPPIAGIENATITKKMWFAVVITIAAWVCVFKVTWCTGQGPETGACHKTQHNTPKKKHKTSARAHPNTHATEHGNTFTSK